MGFKLSTKVTVYFVLAKKPAFITIWTDSVQYIPSFEELYGQASVHSLGSYDLQFDPHAAETLLVGPTLKRPAQ